MATTTITIDDLTGKPLDGTIERRHIEYKGRSYILDLSPESASKLDAALEPFLGRAEPTATLKPSKSVTRAPGASRQWNIGYTDARNWAKANGITVSPNGRVPNDIMQQAEAALSKS